jgi:F-type H+-transporting ATPase subunit b
MHNPTFWEQILQSNIINFLFAFAVLVWIFRKFNVVSILDKRHNEILLGLKAAEERRTKALEELQEIEKRTANLTQEVESILKDAQQTAEAVAQSIVNTAEDEASKILTNTQKRIELEQKTASRDLEQRLMHEAIYAARQLLENTLNDQDRQRSVDDFIVTLPELYEKELQR